jgi:hypothetical protein
MVINDSAPIAADKLLRMAEGAPQQGLVGSV